jgi:Flp pilus assembly protein TadG
MNVDISGVSVGRAPSARSHMMPWLIDFGRDQRGATAVEMGLVLTPLLLFLLGTVEFGRAMWIQNALNYSAAEAARCASNNTTTCGSANEITAFAASRSGANFATSVFTATTPSCGNMVSASYPMHLYIPFGDYSITLTAQACFPAGKAG